MPGTRTEEGRTTDRLTQQSKLEAVEQAICREYNVTHTELHGRGRTERVAIARLAFYHAACQHATRADVARYIGRDPSTVSAGCSTMQGYLRSRVC